VQGVSTSDVVITGLGILSPIGIGRQAFWDSLCQGRSGIGRITSFDASELPCPLAAEVRDFDPKQHIANRKSLKVMSRDAQLGVAACRMACEEAGIAAGAVDPDRMGIVLGADRICTALDDSEPAYRACTSDRDFDFARWGKEGMAGTFPLSFLKVLPNMIASHVSIVLDARGPNNTIHQAELSGLLAFCEAADVVRRGWADVMVAGGASSAIHPFDCIRRNVMGGLSGRADDPAAAVRPFDRDRDGQVWGEGAAAFVLESRRHAEARGAKILANLLGSAVACEAYRGNNGRISGRGIQTAMELALRRASLRADALSHINAHGQSTIWEDQVEAQAIHKVAPAVPVAAPKSYFGNLGAAGGVVEMAVSLLALGQGVAPATLNRDHPDPLCPIDTIGGRPLPTSAKAAMSLNLTSIGQAAAVVIGL
jgi:3-oxoacyl-[acyl-carrier-protein] synthase II